MHKVPIAIFLTTVVGLLASPALAQNASFERFGSGCAGSAGVPSLDAAEGKLPRIGETFRAEFSNLPASAAPFGLIGLVGLSNTEWAGVPLPFDLSPLGVTGCSLYVSVLRANPLLVNGDGSAGWTLHVDNEPSLIGVHFYAQGLVLDPSANAAGYVVTNAGEGVIGANAGPEATIIFPTKVSATDAHSIIVRGTASDPSGVAEVRVNGRLAASGDGFASWQVEVPLERGITDLTVETRDSLGFVDLEAAQARIDSRRARATPRTIAIDTDRNRALIYYAGSPAIMAIDLGTGHREVFSGSSRGIGIALGSPVALEVDLPRNRVLVADSGRRAILVIDLSTGDRDILSDAITGVGPEFRNMRSISVDGSNAYVVSSYYGIQGGELVQIDLATGDRKLISYSNSGQHGEIWNGPIDVVVDDGWAFVLDGPFHYFSRLVPSSLFAVDLTTGVRFRLSGGGAQLYLGSTIAKHGSLILVADQLLERILAVDPVTGDRTILSAAPRSAGHESRGLGSGFQNPVDIAVGGSTILVADSEAGAILEVEFASGDRRYLSRSGVGAGVDLKNPASLTADGDRLLTVDLDLEALVAVDLATGDRHVVSSADIGTGLGFSAVTGMIRVGDRALITKNRSIATLQWVDLATGDRSVLSDSQHGMGPEIGSADGLVLDGSRVLVTSESGWSVTSVDLATGDRTVISDSFTGSGRLMQPGAIAIGGSRAIIVERRVPAIAAVDLQSGDRSIISLDIRNVMPADTVFAWHESELLIEAEDSLLAMDLDTGVYRVVSGLSSEAPGGFVGMGPIPSIDGIVVQGSIAYVSDSGHFGAIMAIDLLTGDRVILSQ